MLVLQEAQDEEYFYLFASIPGQSDLTHRATFHVQMGRDTAILASKAIAAHFEMDLKIEI